MRHDLLLAATASLCLAGPALALPSASDAPSAAFGAVEAPMLPARFCAPEEKAAFLSRVRLAGATARENAAEAMRLGAQARRERVAFASTVNQAQEPLRRATDRGDLEQAAKLAVLIGQFEAEADRLPTAWIALDRAAAQQQAMALRLDALEARAAALPTASCRKVARAR